MKAMRFALTSVFVIFGVSVVLTQPAAAAPTAESCFAFTPATGTITNYYNTEGNVVGAPACPRDVEIPSTIGGVSVTAIAGPSSSTGAFQSKNLTGVVIPDSVITIGAAGFYGNNLTVLNLPDELTTIGQSAFGGGNKITTLHIPDSVTSIGWAAFWNNQIADLHIGSGLTTIESSVFGHNKLTHVTIPGTVHTIRSSAFTENDLVEVNLEEGIQTIGGYAFAKNRLSELRLPQSLQTFAAAAIISQTTMATSNEFINKLYSGCTQGCEAVQEALDSIIFTKVYTQDPSNPRGFEDYIEFDEIEMDGDGDWNDRAVIGGHVINPASLTLIYTNTNDATLSQQTTIMGQTDTGTYMNNYVVTQGPAIPFPTDLWSPTPEESQAIQEALHAYYRLGQEVTITPPAIDGYVTPSTQTFVLGAATNTQTITYYTQAELDVQSPTTPTTPSSPEAETGELAETGISLYVLIAASLAVIVGGMWIFTKGIKQSRV